MKKAIDLLSSRRTSVYLFLVLLVVSLLGALIPQKELPAYYEAHYRAWAVTLLNAFQLTDVYHAWYFILLLAFLVASLTTCTLRRLPRVLGALRRRADAPAALDDFTLREEVGPAAAAPALERAARRLPFRWRRAGEVLCGRRRPYALGGEILTHVGLVVIFVGAFFRLFGARDTVFVFEGQGVALPAAYGAGCELWADRVEEVRDVDTGRVLEYRTQVRLVRGGKEVAAKAVEVNGPLRYGGFGVYQSNMDAAGATGLAVEAVKLGAGESPAALAATTFSWAVAGEKGTAVAAPGQTVPLGATGYRMRYLDYYEHFMTDESGFRNDNPERNPAAFVNVVDPAGAVAMGIIFELYPEFSVIRSSAEAFANVPITITLASAGGADAVGRRAYLLVGGGNVVVGEGGATLELTGADGSVPGHGETALTARLTRPASPPETLTLRPGEWVPVELSDGAYAFRFAGNRRGALTGLTLARDPGLGAFYAGCVLLSLGVAVAMLLSYDELFLYRRGGKVYLAGRSHKGPWIFRAAFDGWAAKIRKGIKTDA